MKYKKSTNGRRRKNKKGIVSSTPPGSSPQEQEKLDADNLLMGTYLRVCTSIEAMMKHK